MISARVSNLIAVALLAAGCSTFGSQMSADQLAAAGKDKNASVVCAVGTGPWGKVVTTYVNVDKSTVLNGSVAVDGECHVVFQNAATVKVTKEPVQ